MHFLWSPAIWLQHVRKPARQGGAMCSAVKFTHRACSFDKQERLPLAAACTALLLLLLGLAAAATSKSLVREKVRCASRAKPPFDTSAGSGYDWLHQVANRTGPPHRAA
jgi:hypothetical protein